MDRDTTRAFANWAFNKAEINGIFINIRDILMEIKREDYGLQNMTEEQIKNINSKTYINMDGNDWFDFGTRVRKRYGLRDDFLVIKKTTWGELCEDIYKQLNNISTPQKPKWWPGAWLAGLKRQN